MKILIVNNNEGNGDWEGIYIDGELVAEDHSLQLYDVLCAIKDRRGPIESLTHLSLDDEQVESMGNSFPSTEARLWEIERGE